MTRTVIAVVLGVGLIRLGTSFLGLSHCAAEPPAAPEQASADDELADRIRVAQRQLLDLDMLARGKILQARGVTPLPRPVVNAVYNVDTFPPVAARFVRFTVLAAKDGAQPCIDELEIYGPEGKDNLARAAGARATASSLLPDHPIHQVHHVNDGKYGNSWSWISSEAGAGWVQIELAAVAPVARLVWSRDARDDSGYQDRLPLKYRIEVSTDGTSWKTVGSDEGRVTEESALTDQQILAALDPAQQARRQELAAELKELRARAATLAEERRLRIVKALQAVQAVIGEPAADPKAINFVALGGIPQFYPQHDAILKDLRGLPQLQRLHLGWSGVSDAGLKNLTSIPSLGEIELESTQVGDSGVRELAALKGLHTLNLANTQITDAVLKDLSELPHLASLNIGRTRVTAAGLKNLQGCKSLRRLIYTNINDAALKNLAEVGLLHTLYKVSAAGPTDQSIVALDLSNTSATAASAKGLALPSLRRISLAATPTRDADLEQLSGLTSLTDLDLSRTAVTSAGMKFLKPLTGLQVLRLSSTQVGGSGWKELAELPELTTLWAGECPLADDDLKLLASMKKLGELSLQRSKLTDEGIGHLKKCKALHTLYILQIDLTDACVKDLKELPELRVLMLGVTKVTPQGIKEIKGAKSLKTLVLTGGNFSTSKASALEEVRQALPGVEVRNWLPRR